jgi:integrase
VAWIKTYKVASGTRYRVYWKDPTGAARGKVFKRLSDARSFKRQIEHELDTGNYADPRRGRILLQELWDEYDAAPARPLAPSTRSLYRMQWGKHIAPRLGRRRINTLEPADIRRFLADLESDGVGRAMIDSCFRLLRSVLAQAVRDRRISRNPASGVAPPRADARTMRFLTADEVTSIADEVPPRYEALIYTLAYTGIRIGEASALRVGSVDLLHRRLSITEAASEVDGVRVLGPTKTRMKRSVTMPKSLADLLTEHLALHSHLDDPGALVFTSAVGSPVGQHSFRRLFRRACTRAGIDPLPRVHDLRHTAASLAIGAGAHAKMIQDMLGHASALTTMNVYGHVGDSMHNDVADRLDAVWERAVSERGRGGNVTSFPGPESAASGS